MKKKYKKSTRPEKSTKKVQNLEIVKKKYSTFKKVRCGNTAKLEPEFVSCMGISPMFTDSDMSVNMRLPSYNDM